MKSFITNVVALLRAPRRGAALALATVLFAGCVATARKAERDTSFGPPTEGYCPECGWSFPTTRQSFADEVAEMHRLSTSHKVIVHPSSLPTNGTTQQADEPTPVGGANSGHNH